MLKKKIFTILVLVLVMFAGISFILPNNKSDAGLHAEIGDITLTDLQTYALTSILSSYASDHTSAVSETEYCLRDDYIIYTQSQNPNGLCWSYAGNNAINTTLMKATGEYVDLSEGWISAVFNYLSVCGDYDDIVNYINENVVILSNGGKYYVGGGGLFIINDYLSRRAGVVLESDFNYDEFNALCSENIDKAFNKYSNIADDDFMQNLKSGYFLNGNSGVTISTNARNSIKNHIKTHGAVSAGMEWLSDSTNGLTTTTYKGKTITYKKPSITPNGGHAITLIGWDDNITLKSGHTGAWIALNSWGDDCGNDGVFYVSYADADFKSVWGYKYEEKSEDVYFDAEITNSSAYDTSSSKTYYKAPYKGAYYKDLVASADGTQQKNIFYQDSMLLSSGYYDYGLTYNYDVIGVDENSIDVSIFRYEEDVTSKFTIQRNTSSNNITIIADLGTYEHLNTGTYKVVFTYKSTDGLVEDKSTSVFYVMDETELGYTYFHFDFDRSSTYLATNDGGVIKNNARYSIYNTYNYSDKNIILASSNSSGYLFIWFYDTAYSNIQSITCNQSGVLFRESESNLDLGEYFYQIYFNLSSGDAKYTFTITTTDGDTRDYDVIFLKAGSSDSMLNVSYETYGGKNNSQNLRREIISGGYAKIYAPSKEGYTFKGWYTDPEFTKALAYDSINGYYKLVKTNSNYVTNPTVDESIKSYYSSNVSISAIEYLYAKWEKIETPKAEYKVTLVYNNGNSNGEFTCTEGNQFIKPTDPTKTGYEFKGWYTTPTFDNGTEYNFNNKVTGNLTLYAKWEKLIVYYTVNVYYNDGRVDPETKQVEEGHTLSLETPSRTGYNFIGWFTTSTFNQGTLYNFDSIVTSNFSLYAKWEKQKFTVLIYYFDSINVNNTQTIEYDGMAIEPTPTKTGYEFKGWYTTPTFDSGTEFSFATKIRANTNIYAKWEKIVVKYTIRLYHNDGSTSPTLKQVEENTTFSVEEPTRTGYDFVGWYTTSTFNTGTEYDFNTPVTSNFSLYAKWSIKTFSVKIYFYDDVTANDTQMIDYNGTATEPTPTKTGYEFKGWYTTPTFDAGTEFSFDTVIRENVNVYARWEKIIVKYTIKIYYNDGSINPNIKLVEENTTFSLDDPTRIGYNFGGWYTSSTFNAGTEYDFNTPVTSNFELYAKWSIKQLTVLIYFYDITNVSETHTINYGTQISEPQIPQKNGYEFAGWYTTDTFEEGSEFSFNTLITENLNVYAKWNKLPEIYTITIYYNDGREDPVTIQVQENLTFTLGIPTKDGYDFGGWYTTDDFQDGTLYDFNTPVTSNFPLYAKWDKIPVKYTITLHYNDNNIGTITKQVVENTSFSIEEPTKDGYDFKGWYTTLDFQEDTLYDFNKLVTSNFSLYAKWDIKKFAVAIYFFDDVTINDNQTVEYNQKATEPTPTKVGFAFAGWYTTPVFDNGTEFSFDTLITEDLKVYAKWNLKSAQILSFESNKASVNTFSTFTLDLIFYFELELNTITDINIEVYRNNNQTNLTATCVKFEQIVNSGLWKYECSISDSLALSGEFTYYAKIILNYNGYNSTKDSNDLVITSSQRPIGIDNISVSGMIVKWQDYGEIENGEEVNYIVNLYKAGTDGSLGNISTQNMQWNISNILNLRNGDEFVYGEGEYSVAIAKIINGGLVGSKSFVFNVYKISFVSYVDDGLIYPEILVVENDKIMSLTSSNDYKENYDFIGWYKAENYDEEDLWDLENDEVTDNFTLYANWEITDDISFDQDLSIFEISATYDKNVSHSLKIYPTHIINGNFTYAWYRNTNSRNVEDMISDTNEISISKAKDSGSYRCEITLTDKDGFTKTKVFDNFVVEIAKAETIIKADTLDAKVFVYSGKEQVVSGGVTIDRTDEAQDILVYKNNVFTDVPEDGKLYVTIIANETDNYKRAEIVVEVDVLKAQSVITQIGPNEPYVYTGKNLVLRDGDFALNNKEQTILMDKNIKNAGKYNVILSANETRNYRAPVSVSVEIEIKKAYIRIKSIDKYSVWLFGLEKLEYQIIDDYDFNIDISGITLSCDADPNKVGTYDIKIDFSDPSLKDNFEISREIGKYTVSAVPYYLAIGVLFALIILWLYLRSRRLYMLDFEENGGSFVSPVETRKKSEIKIGTPQRDGYKFKGWYKDSTLTRPFNGKVKRGKFMNLYAKWEQDQEVVTKTQRDSQIQNILKSYNLLKEEERVIEEPVIIERVEEPIIKEKTEQEKIQDIILLAKDNSKGANTISEEVIKKFEIDLHKNDKKIEEEPKELTHEEIMASLINKAKTTSPNPEINQDIKNIINKVTKNDN